MLKYLSRQSVCITFILTLLCIQFDTFAVNLSLSWIEDEFHISQAKSQWITSAYLLAVGLTMLPAGIAADHLNNLYLVRISAWLLFITHLGCSLAPNMASLIIFRSIQGIAAGMMLPCCIAYLTRHDPRAQAKIAYAVGCSYIAMAVSPLLTLYLTQGLSWRALFAGCAFVLFCACLLLSLPIRRTPAAKTPQHIFIVLQSTNIPFSFWVFTGLGSLSNILLLQMIFSFPQISQNFYAESFMPTAYAYFALAVAIIAGSVLKSVRSQQSHARFFVSSLIITTLCYSLLYFYPQMPYFYFLMLSLIIGFTLSSTNTMTLIQSQAVAPLKIAGFCAGLFKMAITTLGALGVIYLGSMIEDTPMTLQNIKSYFFCLLHICCMACIIACLWAWKQGKVISIHLNRTL